MAKRSSTAALGTDLARALKRKGFDVRTLEMSSEITVSRERAPWVLVESIFLRFDEEAGQHVWCWSSGDAIGPAHDHETVAAQIEDSFGRVRAAT